MDASRTQPRRPLIIYRQVKSSNIAGIAYLGPAGEDLLLTDPNPRWSTAKPREEPLLSLRVHPSAAQGTLFVCFKGRAQAPGDRLPAYSYQGVPAGVVKELLEAESITKAFNANLKGNKAYHGAKVDEYGAPLDQPQEA